jgi:hypothetical protein
MKILEILKKIGIVIWNIIMMHLPIVVAFLIGIVVGLIWNAYIGFFTFFGLGVLYTLFLMGRQLYWWISKTGDYEENNKEEL